jgi:hypothetical protein
LASATVAAGTAAPLTDRYRFATITPLALAVGTYRVGAQLNDGANNDGYLNFSNFSDLNSSISLPGSHYSSVANSFAFPTLLAASGPSTTFQFDAVNLRIATTAVPEPSSFAILAMGAIALVGYRRRKWKQTA